MNAKLEFSRCSAAEDLHSVSGILGECAPPSMSAKREFSESSAAEDLSAVSGISE